MESKASDEEVVNAFVRRTSRYSLREAGLFVGVSHTKVAEWRAGEVAPLQPLTRRALEDYLDTPVADALSDSDRQAEDAFIASRDRAMGLVSESASYANHDDLEYALSGVVQVLKDAARAKDLTRDDLAFVVDSAAWELAKLVRDAAERVARVQEAPDAGEEGLGPQAQGGPGS